MNDMSKFAADKMALALQQFGEMFEQYSVPFKQFQENIKKYQPVLEGIATISAIYKTAEELSENQFVVVAPIPREAVQNTEAMNADSLAEKYLTEAKQVRATLNACGLMENRVFQQASDAFGNASYDLAILGFTAVLDKMLSNCSDMIKDVNINMRSEAIIKKIKDKGDIYLDELEGKDFLLIITYPTAIDLFGKRSDFRCGEPDMLNRHWIMHGRTVKEYSRLDCVKVLNMIYGTIRMGELGKQDSQSADMK